MQPDDAPAFEVVRAGAAPRIAGADLHGLELADLISVEDILDPPRRPVRALTLTAVLFGAALLVALIGVFGPSREGSLAAGQVTLAGVDVASGERIDVDLAQPVLVQITDPRLAPTVSDVDLEFSYVGIPVTELSAVVRDGTAVLDPGSSEHLVGGAATATVRLRSDGAAVAEHEVGLRGVHTWYLTAPFVLAVLLLLLAYANLESSLKPLRGGHSRALSYAGAFVASAVGGVGVVVLAAALGLREPTVPNTVLVAALAAAAGVTTARARVGLARRRRVRKAVHRAEKRLNFQGFAP